MKTPKEWIDENSGSHTLSYVEGNPEAAVEFVRNIQTDAVKACWESINKWIRTGPLEGAGNGTDPQAERNGMIGAANQVMEILQSIDKST